MRRAAKVDTVQAEIVEGLRKAGYMVCPIGRPVDLLVGKWFFVPHRGDEIPHDPCYRWTPMEVKTLTKTGAMRVRRDQDAQEAFIRETGCPVVTSLESALKALEAL
jgi:hypothetical protein